MMTENQLASVGTKITPYTLRRLAHPWGTFGSSRKANNKSVHQGTEVLLCSHCGQRQHAPSSAYFPRQGRLDSRVAKWEEITLEQSNTIKALRQELLDRDQRANRIMAHYEQLVRLEKGLVREAEEAERKAEAEIGFLTEELERLQALLTTRKIGG